MSRSRSRGAHFDLEYDIDLRSVVATQVLEDRKVLDARKDMDEKSGSLRRWMIQTAPGIGRCS